MVYKQGHHSPGIFVFATLFVIVLIVGIFALDITRRWWRETEWRRRWNERDENDDN